MTLEEAIKHALEAGNRLLAKDHCSECGKEHLQLASWLKELKDFREAYGTLPMKNFMHRENLIDIKEK